MSLNFQPLICVTSFKIVHSLYILCRNGKCLWLLLSMPAAKLTGKGVFFSFLLQTHQTQRQEMKWKSDSRNVKNENVTRFFCSSKRAARAGSAFQMQDTEEGTPARLLQTTSPYTCKLSIFSRNWCQQCLQIRGSPTWEQFDFFICVPEGKQRVLRSIIYLPDELSFLLHDKHAQTR